MQYRSEASDLSTTEFRIGQHSLQRACSRRRQRSVAHILMRANERSQLPRQREGHQEVVKRQQLCDLFGAPVAVVRGLAVWTVAIAAGCMGVMDGRMSFQLALRAAVADRAESSCSAVCNQLQNATMLGRQVISIRLPVRTSILRANLTQSCERSVLTGTS